MSVKLRSWFVAARPLAQANLAGPLLLGEALAYHLAGRFSWGVLLAVALFGIADQLFIVFANDYADRDHDTDQRTPFSGGSGVIQSGAIPAQSLRRAALAMMVLVFAITGTILEFGALPSAAHGGILFGLALLGVVLVQSYSFAPLRLSYRGGGAFLQGLGIGGVLPLYGYVAQGGPLETFPWALLLGTIMLGTAGNLATALPDVRADRAASKRTLAVTLGVNVASRICLLLSMGSVAWLTWLAPDITGDRFVAAATLPLLAMAPLRLEDPPDQGGQSSSAGPRLLLFVFLQGGALQVATLGWALWLAFH